MSTTRSKLNYLMRSIQKRATGYISKCPNCGSTGGITVDSKLLVTRLLECSECKLLYRVPTDTTEENSHFYQSAYEQDSTTELPDDQELNQLIQSNFTGQGNDHTPYLKLFEALNVERGTRVLDYGCSWGYGTYQFRKAGMCAEGYELSRQRAAFARDRLSLPVCAEIGELQPHFGVFFSSHVLEHVADLQGVFSLARRLTKRGGLFLALTPNGSPEYRAANAQAFHRLWGLAHPNLLQAEFVKNIFGGHPLFLASDPYPYDAIASWDRSSFYQGALYGWELLIIAVF